MRRFLWIVPVIALFAVGGIGLFRVRPAAEIGQPPADFSLRSVTDPDRTITLADQLGTRPVVLNFWASWCEPCKDEAPEFRAAALAFEDEVTFLGVSTLDGRGPASRFMEAYDVPFDSVTDPPPGRAAKRFGVTGVPETIFIDRDGRVVGRYIGAFTGDQLEGLVRRLLDLAPGDALDITGRGESRPVP